MLTYKTSPYCVSDIKDHIRVGLPLIGTRLLHAVASFINMMFIARLGHTEVAASALIFGTLSMLTLIMWSFLYSLAVIVGRFHGAGDIKQVNLSLNAGLLLSIIIAIPFSIIIWNANLILLFFHQNFSLTQITEPYFHVFALSVLPSLWIVCFDEFVMGILRAKLVIIWTLISSPLSLILGYGFLFGKFGLPKFGIAGIALANVVSSWSVFAIIALYFFLDRDLQKYTIFRIKGHAILKYVGKIIKLSWPIAIQLGTISFAYTFLAYMIGWLNESSLVAHQIATQYVSVAIMIPYGMAQSSAVLIAQALGAKRQYVQQLGYSGIILALILVVLFSVVYWFFPKILIAGYLNLRDINNYGSIALAVILLGIIGITQLTDTIGVIANGILRGFHDTRIPMIISLISNWVISIPIGYYFAFILHFGAIGLYYGFLIGSIFGAVILTKRFNILCK